MSSSLQHIAVIMDGNRRWAEQQGLSGQKGYIQGIKSVKETIQTCLAKGVSYLTLFVFSTENWKRKDQDIHFLFSLMDKSLEKNRKLFSDEQVRLHILGDVHTLPSSLKKILLDVCEETKQNKKLHLILALNYGGKKEILDGIEKTALLKKELKNISEKDFEKNLPSSAFPPPDLIIRTGGVRRLSNFYLWSSAYSELYFTDVLWPEFDSKECCKAFDYYEGVVRRFGGA